MSQSFPIGFINPTFQNVSIHLATSEHNYNMATVFYLFVICYLYCLSHLQTPINVFAFHIVLTDSKLYKRCIDPELLLLLLFHFTATYAVVHGFWQAWKTICDSKEQIQLILCKSIMLLCCSNVVQKFFISSKFAF